MRGFSAPSESKRRRLEAAGEAFILGYNLGLLEFDPRAIRERLATVADDDRGFAFEGAAMGVAVGDALPFSPPGRLVTFLANLADDYLYLGYVGVGWAMARTPWRSRVLLATLDPLLKWLVWDGRGFHDVYFQRRGALKRPGSAPGGYAPRAYDQGVGRALWFAAGADAALAVRLVRAQDPQRARDLFSGLGLAIAYAGAATEDDLREVSAAAGKHRPRLAQGAAFAAEAHSLAGRVPSHTEAACQVLCGCSAEVAAALVRTHRRELPSAAEAAPDTPPYEVWRARVAEALLRSTEPVA